MRASQIGQGLPDPTVGTRRRFAAVDGRRRRHADARASRAGLRVHGAEGYLSDIAKGRLAALRGEAPEKALEAVAKAHAERTKVLGPKAAALALPPQLEQTGHNAPAA